MSFAGLCQRIIIIFHRYYTLYCNCDYFPRYYAVYPQFIIWKMILYVCPPLLRPGGLGGTRRKHRPGFHLATKNPLRFRRRRRGTFSPPHSRRNQRLMIPSGPPRPPGHEFPRSLSSTSFQRAKVLIKFWLSARSFSWLIFWLSLFSRPLL